jgi:predicted Zn-dependent protease
MVDPDLRDSPTDSLETQESKLRKAVSRYPQVQLASAEFFADIDEISLVNSRGIDARQEATKIYVEWFLTAEANGKRVESYTDLTRRRAEDLHITHEADRKAGYTVDQLKAVPPQPYRGPVVVRDSTLASMMTSIVLKRLSSAEAKFKGITPWEVGKPVFSGAGHGGDVTLWANRTLPYGTYSNRFDQEGLPADRILLIQDGILETFTASQRFAEYLELPATGTFGNVDLAPGTEPSDALLAEPHVEIAVFSWFFPDALSGEFASEVRLGYIVDENGRRPFRGGMLVGNLIQALSNVRFSSETGFFGDYVGPIAARFEDLRLTQG